MGGADFTVRSAAAAANAANRTVDLLWRPGTAQPSYRLRRMTGTGTVELTYGGGDILPGSGTMTITRGRTPVGVAVNPAGTRLYVVEANSHTVTTFTLSDGDIQGSGTATSTGNTGGSSPSGVAVR